MTEFDCTRGYEVPETNTLPKQKPARMGEVFDRAIEEAKTEVLPFESWERLKGKPLSPSRRSARSVIMGRNGISARRLKAR